MSRSQYLQNSPRSDASGKLVMRIGCATAGNVFDSDDPDNPERDGVADRAP
jgi:hypothetical protein